MEKEPKPRDIEKDLEEREILGGAHIDKLEVGKKLKVETQNTSYTIEHREDGLYISGHPKYCPSAEKIRSIGSTWGGHAIRNNFAGR